MPRAVVPAIPRREVRAAAELSLPGLRQLVVQLRLERGVDVLQARVDRLEPGGQGILDKDVGVVALHHDRHGDPHRVAELRGADRFRRRVEQRVLVRDREAAVERVDALRRCEVAQVERVVEPAGLLVVAGEREDAGRAGLEGRERDRLRRGRRRRVRLHESGEHVLGVELNGVAVVAGELAGRHCVARQGEHAHADGMHRKDQPE